MALKKATFPFTARYALQRYLNRPRAGLNVDTIEKGLEFYEKLSLSFVQHWVVDNSDANGTLRLSKVLEATDLEGEPIKPVSVRIDEPYLTWLRDVLKEHDWNLVTLQDGRTATVSTALELQVCIGALYKSVNAAISAKDEDSG